MALQFVANLKCVAWRAVFDREPVLKTTRIRIPGFPDNHGLRILDLTQIEKIVKKLVHLANPKLAPWLAL